MDILFLTPQPIYQDRGSPIAVDLVLRALSERRELVDAVTYHEGKNIDYENIHIHRTLSIPFIHNIKAGFSWKKIICDFLMVFKIIPLLVKKRYQLVHAVEEAVFFALLIKLVFRIPYIYDMDSSLAQQMVEQLPWLSPFSPFLNFFEGLAVKHAKVVVPVCDALAKDIERYRPNKVVVLQDISLLKETPPDHSIELKDQLGIEGLLLMYVGNLQTYQGIDLLLESFALAFETTKHADLVIIGGVDADIRKYQDMSYKLKIDKHVHFLGPKPVEHLATYLSQADILVSPRTKGRNTPMKIYSYLHSGKPLLATNMPTHTQILNEKVAMLAEPNPEAFAEKMVYLIEDQELRSELGAAGEELIEESYSYEAFRKKLNQLFDWLKREIDQDPHDSTTSRVPYTSTEAF